MGDFAFGQDYRDPGQSRKAPGLYLLKVLFRHEGPISRGGAGLPSSGLRPLPEAENRQNSQNNSENPFRAGQIFRRRRGRDQRRDPSQDKANSPANLPTHKNSPFVYFFGLAFIPLIFYLILC